MEKNFDNMDLLLQSKIALIPSKKGKRAMGKVITK